MDIYLLIEGQQTGPYTEEQVRQSLAEGLISGDLPAWREGLLEWVGISNVLLYASGVAPYLPPKTDPKIAVSDSRRSLYYVGIICAIGLLIFFFWRYHLSSNIEGTYRIADNTLSLAIISESEVDITTSEGTFAGLYKRDGDSFRVIVTVLGTQRVYSLKKIAEGLQDQSGVVFYSSGYFEAIQLLRQANGKYVKGDNEGAIADYTQMIRTFPNYPAAFAGRAGAKQALGDVDGAIADYQTAIQIDPGKEDYRNALAGLQNVKAASERAELIKNVGRPPLKLDLSNSSDSLRLPDDAQIQSLVLASQSPTAKVEDFSNLGKAYLKIQKYEDAIDAFNAAIRLSPNDAKLHNDYGFACYKQNWLEVAIKEFEKAEELDPADVEAHFNLAVVYAMQTPPELDLARKEYQKALELGAAKDDQMESLLK